LKKGSQKAPLNRLFSNVQFLDQGPVFLNILLFEVVQEASALSNQLNQGALGVEVFLVSSQVGGQVVDPMGEQRNLTFCGTRIGFRTAMLFEDVGLDFIR
jgi:hypothetical protein